MTKTVRQLLLIARDRGLDLPEGEYKLTRCYAIQCGYPEGWSWLLKDAEGLTVLASQWGAKDLIDAFPDGTVGIDLDDECPLLYMLPAREREMTLTHYGQSRPFAGCRKGWKDGDSLTMDGDQVDCRDCRKTVRKAAKAAADNDRRERAREAYEESLSPEQRTVYRRIWGLPPLNEEGT